MPVDTDRMHLHPVLRSALAELDMRLRDLGIPLRLYEGARTPDRQAALYLKGRGVGPAGQTVTKAKPWQSFHQFGLAADYVFFVDGKWTWKEPDEGMWDRYTLLAEAAQLRTLSFERPHAEWPSPLALLQVGHYPEGGDDSWRSWLETQVESWGHDYREVGGITMPGAPPLFIERPTS